MQADTTGNILDTIRNVRELGATIVVNGDGNIVVDFGSAVAPSGLIEALRAHKPELLRLYEHTRPGYKPPATKPAGKPTAPMPEWLAGQDDDRGDIETIPTVAYTWWQPGMPGLVGDVAIDTETEALATINEPGGPVPRMVLATATDGTRGYYLAPATIGPFLREHTESRLVFHNVSFDAAVLADAAGPTFWQLVDANRVICTLAFERLLNLARYGSARVFPSLDYLAQKYCGQAVVKDAADEQGNPIRTSFGQFIGRPVTDIPQNYLDYASGDTSATLAVWRAQLKVLAGLREQARAAYGFPGDEALERAWQEYGPLTLAVQVKASILATAMGRQGICFDQARRDEVLRTLHDEQAQAAGQLRAEGIFVPTDPVAERIPKWEADEMPDIGPAVKTSVQKYMEARELEMLADGTIEGPFDRTETGRLSMNRETRDAWLERGADPVLLGYARYERARKWATTYADKMQADRAHPKWNPLLNTGRWSCTGSLALQTLPKCGSVPADRMTLRQCITPGPAFVFVAADYSQIELVSLAAAMQYQTGFGQGLADLIRSGTDIHRALAAQVLGKEPEAVTAEERLNVKPVSFGQPGAMGARTIQRVAKNNYRLDLTVEQCQAIMQAYLRIAPELEQHLAQRVDVGERVARLAGLSQGWEGHRILKVLRGDNSTASGQELEPDAVAQCWNLAQRLAGIIQGNRKNREHLQAQLADRQPSKELHDAVKRAASSESSITMTGRLRARCSFAAARNNLFQGPVADGAVLALWRLWRMGYRPALFVHDELVFAVHDDGKAHLHAEGIARVMQEEMSKVLFGLPVGIESFVSASFSKRDKLAPGEIAGITAQAEGQPAEAPRPSISVKVQGPKARQPKAKAPTRFKNPKTRSWDETSGELPF